MTNFNIERKGKHVEFTSTKEETGYDSDIESYTLKLNGEKAPKKVQAAKAKYKEVNSIEEAKENQETYFFDEDSQSLYINVPADENYKVKVYFN